MCGQLHLADGAYSWYHHPWVCWGSDLSYLKNSVRHPMLSTIQPATVATARMALFAVAMPTKLSARYHCLHHVGVSFWVVDRFVSLVEVAFLEFGVLACAFCFRLEFTSSGRSRYCLHDCSFPSFDNLLFYAYSTAVINAVGVLVVYKLFAYSWFLAFSVALI